MIKQQTLPFRSVIPARPKLVTLGNADRIERQRCVDQDIEFPPSMLEDTRCQRMGVSRGYFDGLFRMDRNRELADEECILRSEDWEYEACPWVNWPRATAIGKATAKEFQGAYADFVESRMKQPEQQVTRRGKRG
jgi:hypothetical protein